MSTTSNKQKQTPQDTTGETIELTKVAASMVLCEFNRRKGKAFYSKIAQTDIDESGDVWTVSTRDDGRIYLTQEVAEMGRRAAEEQSRRLTTEVNNLKARKLECAMQEEMLLKAQKRALERPVNLWDFPSDLAGVKLVIV